MTRTHRDTWQAAGAATLARRARAQVDAILAEPAVPVLRGDQLAAIAAIRDKAFSRLK